MPNYRGYVVKKEYFAVEVEAENGDQAKDLMWDCDLMDEPVDTDWEIYDITEAEHE